MYKAKSIEEFKKNAAYFTGNESYDQTRRRIRRENKLDEKIANGTLKRSRLFSPETTHFLMGGMLVSYPPGFFDEGGAWDTERKANEAKDKAKLASVDARSRKAGLVINTWNAGIVVYLLLYGLLYTGLL